MSTAERTVIAQEVEENLNQEHAESTWLILQEEIRDRLIQLKKLTALGVIGGLDDSLAEVNRKIEKYNELVPAPLLRKPEVTRAAFIAQLPEWE